MIKGVPEYYDKNMYLCKPIFIIIPSRQHIETEINRRLKEVDLLHVKKAPINTYSGGMKRRISLAISAIG
jgi:ABC-type multidrug transport system ATPase subunit